MSNDVTTFTAYWADVADMAQAILEAVGPGGEVDSAEALTEWTHESIDGHGRIIYTQQAMACLLHSPNDGIGIADGLTNGLDESGSINYPALAFAAFQADVQEHLSLSDFDFSEPFPCPDSECGLSWETRDEATECCAGTLTTDVMICADCRIMAANGEGPEGGPYATAEGWEKLATLCAGYSPWGGEDSEEHEGFSATPCDTGCGQGAGDRYPASYTAPKEGN